MTHAAGVESDHVEPVENGVRKHADRIPVTANKSMTGHMFAASGALEAIVSLLTIERSLIPPTINYETPDPDCDLDYAPNVAKERKVRAAISNSFGLGGHNATIVFRQFRG